MSLLIEGLSMPKKPTTLYVQPDGRVWMMNGGDRKMKAVEVKEPHGRLIDAEAFVDYVQNRYDNNEITNGDWIGFRLAMKDQPTIVPAEGGGE